MRAAWTIYADAFKALASELGVSTRHFSVPSYLPFLIAGSPDGYSATAASSSQSSLRSVTAQEVPVMTCRNLMLTGDLPGNHECSTCYPDVGVPEMTCRNHLLTGDTPGAQVDSTCYPDVVIVVRSESHIPIGDVCQDKGSRTPGSWPDNPESCDRP